jgi:Zn-dependent protease
MKGSIRLGSVLGITVRMHWLFLAVPMALLAFTPDSGLRVLLLLAMLFGSVFLHELGHSLMARHFGIRVLDITFWPLGGMARMSEIPESPKVEGLIAIAGPAVNFALIALTLPLMAVLGPDALDGELRRFAVINGMLGVFNLLPAFPMDGGRILRALLGLRFEWLRATEIAVRVGRWFALAMGIAAFPTRSPALALIGLFVWWAGFQELLAMRVRRARAQFAGFGPEDLFRAAAQTRWASGAASAAAGAAAPPRSANGAAQRHGDGISDADVEALERFRGRLDSFGRRP